MEAIILSLIPCVSDCLYQKDGYCTLERAGSKGDLPSAAAKHTTGSSAENTVKEATEGAGEYIGVECINQVPRKRRS